MKYKACHGQNPVDSPPGAPVPEDDGDAIWLSPTVRTTYSVLAQMMPAGTPITMPRPEPTPQPIAVNELDVRLSEYLGRGAVDEGCISLSELGRLRMAVLRELSRLPDNDSFAAERVLQAIFDLAASTLNALGGVAQMHPKPTMTWTEVAQVRPFLAKTLLFSDHVLIQDVLFDALGTKPTNHNLRTAAQEQLALASLISMGAVIPAPGGVAMALRGDSAKDLTADDLGRPGLVRWVREQLQLEGPTAREALLASVKDDHPGAQMMWLYARFEPVEEPLERTGRMRMLGNYDPQFDYGPWLDQVRREATISLIQRTNERVVTADAFASNYVATSPFEARLLHRRRIASPGLSQAAIWADIPTLPDLNMRGLASALGNDDAVHNLRERVQAALATTRAPAAQTDAITNVASELNRASLALERRGRTDRAWSLMLPAAFGAGTIGLGAFGGLPGVAAALLSTLGSLAPYLGSRIAERRDASYLFVSARRFQRRRS